MRERPAKTQPDINQLIAVCRKVLDRWNDGRLLAIYLYGSILGTRHRSDSDVDIAILDDEDNCLSWEEQCGLMDELEKVTGRPVDLRILREGTLSYQTYVLDNGKPIWIVDEKSTKDYADRLSEKLTDQYQQRRNNWFSVISKLAVQFGPQK